MSRHGPFEPKFRTKAPPTLAGGRAVDKPQATMPIRGLRGTLLKKFTGRFTSKSNALTRNKV